MGPLEAAGARLTRVAVDTGGTFTDCVARLPDGALARAKVLSNGAVRGRVVEVERDRLRLTAPWTAVDGFFRGATASFLADGRTIEIEDSTGSGWLTATRATAARLTSTSVGETLELFGRTGRNPPDRTDRIDRIDGSERIEAPILAARLALGVPLDQPLPPVELRLATTRGTNALLERRGARVAFFVTAGFADLLAIGSQERADLFAIAPRKPSALYATVVEVDERLAADGTILRPLDESVLRREACRLRVAGYDCAAVALMHADGFPAHELRVLEILAAEGFRWLARSSLSPFRRIVPRAQTAVVDAYLAPLLDDYVARVATQAGSGSSVRLLTSAGGLVPPASFRGSESLFSGPAGGVLGAVQVGRAAGFPSVLGFDMGGTSTDVARADGQPSYRFSSRVGEVEVVVPSVAISTVAAGGGSILHLDGARLAVGPESAGADPGPACYGAGGPLTVTDANVLLGRLWVDGFEVPIDRGAAEARANELADAAGVAVEDLLLDGLAIADERMASAIRDVSTREGFDPRSHALVAFGGAGGQHACRIAELLGIDEILAPQDASLLSARGLLAARDERFAERQILRPLEGIATGEWRALWSELEGRARVALTADGIPDSEIEVVRRLVRMRLVGQESTLDIPLSVDHELGDLEAAFARAYREVFGDSPPERAREIESIRLVAGARASEMDELEEKKRIQGGKKQGGAPGPAASAEFSAAGLSTDRPVAGSSASRPVTARVRSAAGWIEAAVYARSAVLARPGALVGPMLIVERFTSWWVDAGWSVESAAGGALLLRRLH